MGQARQLVAIMFTDLTGYSALMGVDEERAMLVLELSRTLQQKLVSKFEGKWIKELGDGAIIVFDSVLNAVNCAIAIQKQVRDSGDFRLKIAIHSSEVMVREGDILGDGVNLTARMEQIAQPNTILVSGKAYSNIQNIKSINTTGLGQFQFKNIERPVSIYAVMSPGLAIPDLEKNELRIWENDLRYNDELLSRVNELVNNYLTDPQLSVAFLCIKLAMSRAQLYRKLQSLTGFSPSDYIRETRLQKASRLLKNNDRNVSEVAYEVGLNNLSYFSKIFHERFGNTPSEYAQLNKTQHGIPAPLNKFIGRKQELNDVFEILQKARLLTLTGTGGTGKTRLATQVIREFGRTFRHGSYFVQLAPVIEARQVLPKISQVLKIQQDPTKKTFSSLADFISDREILLLLDNFEHVMDAAFQLNKLLGSCPNLKILVTSRIVLNINGEYEYPVPQLPLPQRDKYHSIKELQAIPSVQLLVTRARAIKPTFELTNKNKRAIIEICIKLDGLPLALELAAARIKIFSPEALNKRLSFNFDLLSSNSENTPDRHKTLRNAIDWSYSLLSVEEQTLFRRLSVFSGGCNIEAAQDVCFRDYLDNLDIIDSLSGLVNKSLLQQEEQYDGEPRFFMLETIKAFGQEKLKLSLEEDLIMQRYIAFFLSLLEEAKQNLTGPEQGNWLDLLELELDNIRSILTWAEGRSDVEMGLKVTVAVWRFWTIRSMVREGAQWMSRLLSLAKEQSETKLHCRALNAYGMMFSLTNNISDSFQVFNDSLRIARKLDYREGLAEVLNHLGWVYHFDCQFDLSEQYSNEAMQIQKELGNQRGISVSYNNLAVVAAFRGQMKSSFDLYNKSKSIRKEIGDIRGYAYSLINQAWIEIFMGKYFKSNQNTSLGIEILSKLSDTQLLAWAKTVRALNLFHMGKLKASKNLALEAQPLWEKSGTHTGLLRAKVIYLLCRLREYDFSGLKRELADLMENSGRVAKVLIFDIRYAMALLSLYKKDEEQAYEYSRENLRHILTVGSHIYTCDNLELISYLSLRKKNSKTALKLYSTASILRNKLQMPIPQVLQSFHHDLNRQLVSHFDTVTYDTLWKQGQALDARSCMRLLR